MDKIAIGIPSVGSQDPSWWVRMMVLAATFPREGVELCGVLNANSVAVDSSRNLIVDHFLKSKLEWLFWIDADTRLPLGAVRSLLNAGKTMVTGLYYAKSGPSFPIVYVRNEVGYEPLTTWERGELREIDGAGLGCCLMHRSVFEDVQRQWKRFRLPGGGDTLVHVDDIRGEVRNGTVHKNDRLLIDGQLHVRLTEPPENVTSKFPFFALEHQRTEDFWFFEKAQRAGHKLYMDTLVECDHYGSRASTGEEYRERLQGWQIVHKPKLITEIKPGHDLGMWEAFRDEKD